MSKPKISIETEKNEHWNIAKAQLNLLTCLLVSSAIQVLEYTPASNNSHPSNFLHFPPLLKKIKKKFWDRKWGFQSLSSHSPLLGKWQTESRLVLLMEKGKILLSETVLNLNNCNLTLEIGIVSDGLWKKDKWAETSFGFPLWGSFCLCRRSSHSHHAGDFYRVTMGNSVSMIL